ncbi:hypothetical protein AB0B07_09395 [Streptomyces sioyaensis]|uniref:hypothetical protein n=1 Tax=Streptomyces sioyaensis TaxID=67364 RepID=UPI003401A709
MGDTFDGKYHRPRTDGTRRRTSDGQARTRRAAQDRTSFDQAPDGDGCAASVVVALATITAILGALLS